MNIGNLTQTIAHFGHQRLEAHVASNLNAGVLWPLIENHTALQGIKVTGLLTDLKKHLVGDKQRAGVLRKQRVLNASLLTFDEDPAGYIVYSPAHDITGNYGFYISAFFITDELKEKGLEEVVWTYLANKTAQEGATFMKWPNLPEFQNASIFFETQFMPKQIDELVLDGTPLLQDGLRVSKQALEEYETRPITIYDAGDISWLGMEADIAFHAHGKLPIAGFITRETATPKQIAAVTLAALTYSFPEAAWGLNLESTVFSPSVTDAQKSKIVHSTVHALTHLKIAASEFNHITSCDIRFVRWHSSANKYETNVLKTEFSLEADKMVHQSDPKTILYVTSNKNAAGLGPAPFTLA